MSRKLILKFFSIFVVFASFLGNIAYSYKEEAFKLALANAKKYTHIRCDFSVLLGLEECTLSTISTPIGYHNVQSYCRLIGCKREDLKNLLDGEILPEGCVDDDMIKDFINLAKEVTRKLEEDECLIDR